MLKLFCVEYEFRGSGGTHTDIDHFVAGSREDANQYAEERRKRLSSESYSVRTLNVWEVSIVDGHRIWVD